MDFSQLLLLAKQCKTPAELEQFIENYCRAELSARPDVEQQLSKAETADFRPDGRAWNSLFEFLHQMPNEGAAPRPGSAEARAEQPLPTCSNADADGGCLAFDAEVDVQIGDLLADKYRIRELIGRGGMGAVFAADQITPVSRSVAIKVIKSGMDSVQVLARFAQERQALAMMDHPNIARVYDGGLTRLGRPYFVMELVHGLSLNQFCDQEKLDIRTRIELFIRICHAIQHAHQKGIIHRDVKPGNILVALVDGKPTPKIIDFGLAKAMHGGLGEHSAYTARNAVVGTLEYMAPEQARLTNLDIDTRADIYSLGVVIYEVLCGRVPLSREEELGGSQDEAIRTIREVVPKRPSTRISVAMDADQVAAKRRIEGFRLRRLLRGDLDWIVMKCLEKERDRRYETAQALADDLNRYLRDELVMAVPPSSRYRLKKFARRHWGKLAIAGAMLFFLAVSAVATTAGWIRAVRAENSAKNETAVHRALVNFIQRDMFDAVDPDKRARLGLPPDADVRLRTLVDRVSRQVDHGDLSDQPLVEAALRLTLAKAYGSMGLQLPAMQHARRADDLRVSHLGPEHPDRLDTLELVGQLEQYSGELDKARATFERVLEVRRRLDGDDARSVLDVRYKLASLKRNQNPGEAESELRKLAADQGRVLGWTDEDSLQTNRTLGEVLTAESKYDEAESVLRETLATWESTGDRYSPGLLNTLNSLAIVCGDKKKLKECEDLYRDLIPRAETIYSKDHPIVAVYKNNLAICLFDKREYEDSILLLRDVEPVFDRIGAKKALTLTMKYNLASAYVSVRRFEEASSVYASLAPIYIEVYGPNNEKTWKLFRFAFDVQLKLHKPQQAVLLLKQLLQSQRALHPVDNKAIVKTIEKLAPTFAGIDHPSAISLLREVLHEMPSESAERQMLQNLLEKINK